MRKRNTINKLLRFLLILTLGFLCSSYSNTRSLRQLLDAIKLVETGTGSGINVKGDNNLAYGPYQIHKEYFIDSKVSGKWELCLTSKEFSEQVMIAYWNRYNKKALQSLDYEILSRIHNGGPKGHTKSSTLKYWQKVQKCIK